MAAGFSDVEYPSFILRLWRILDSHFHSNIVKLPPCVMERPTVLRRIRDP
jgi:hypothetical protein